MKVVGITRLTAEFIETDEGKGNYPYYRRGGAAQWENLMGESWETYDDNGELEAAYQAFKKEQDDISTSKKGSQDSA